MVASTPTMWRASVDLPAPEGPMIPKHLAGVDAERHAAQDRPGWLAAATKVRPSTERCPSGRGNVRPASRAGLSRQQLTDPEKRATRRDKVAPGADNLLDRLQGPPKQNAGGKHGSDRGRAAQSRDRRQDQGSTDCIASRRKRIRLCRSSRRDRWQQPADQASGCGRGPSASAAPLSCPWRAPLRCCAGSFR